MNIHIFTLSNLPKWGAGWRKRMLEEEEEGGRKEEREGVERMGLISLKDAVTFPCGCFEHKSVQY